MVSTVIMLLTLQCAASESGSNLTIVENGASAYRIVIPDTADAVTQYAAKELQHFLAQISGATLPIVPYAERGDTPAFVLGACPATKDHIASVDLREWPPDSVLLTTQGNDVWLLGQNGRGQLYSVYVLLEEFLGVRFLARDCTVVPKQDVLTLPPIDYAHRPPYMYRETLYFDSFPKEIAARQRLNGPTTECDEEVGGKITFFPYVHSFCKLVPPDVYFETHPEYFSLVGGERKGTEIHGQLCLTNPDVLKIATEQVLKWIEENPDVPIIDVSQNDGNGACECEACMKIVEAEGSRHGPILRFVNAIADVVAEKHPDVWIETLAYAYATKPPAITKPRDNVIIRLCHAGCFCHGFQACGLGANFATYVDEWSAITDHVFIWYYATNFAHYLAPNQNLDALVKDLRFFAGRGVNGLMVQGDYQSPGGELAELRQYIAAQLMWDPSRNPDVLRREFCDGYYGPAAKDVMEYLALLDEAAKNPDLHPFAAWDPKDTVSPELLEKGLVTLARAREHASTPEEKNRVAKLLLPLWYMQLTYPDRYGLSAEAAPATLAEVKAVAEANAITHVREGGEPNMAAWLSDMAARVGEMSP